MPCIIGSFVLVIVFSLFVCGFGEVEMCIFRSIGMLCFGRVCSIYWFTIGGSVCALFGKILIIFRCSFFMRRQCIVPFFALAFCSIAINLFIFFFFPRFCSLFGFCIESLLRMNHTHNSMLAICAMLLLHCAVCWSHFDRSECNAAQLNSTQVIIKSCGPFVHPIWWSKNNEYKTKRQPTNQHTHTITTQNPNQIRNRFIEKE